MWISSCESGKQGVLGSETLSNLQWDLYPLKLGRLQARLLPAGQVGPPVQLNDLFLLRAHGNFSWVVMQLSTAEFVGHTSLLISL